MDNLFKTRALTMAVNNMRPVRTPILDKVFRRRRGQVTDRLAWDVKSGSERILKNIKVTDAAQVENNLNYKTITVTAPRFAPKRLIRAADLNAARQFGEMGVQRLAETIGDNQADMRMNVDRTREYLALNALLGSVVDSEGTELVDYGFENDVQLITPDADWDAEGAKIVNDVRAWKKLIADRVPVDEWVCFCASDVMDAMIDDSALRELMKNTAGQQIAETGRIRTVAGIGEIEEYFGTYLVGDDGSAVRTQMFPDGTFILVGFAADSFSEQYAPVVDLQSETGVGSGREAQLFHSKAWDEEDPSGKWIKVESRPLPCVHRPEAIVVATVLNE